MRPQPFRQAVRASLCASLILLGFTPATAQEARVELEQKPLPPLPTSISGSENVRGRVSAWLRSHPDRLQLGQGEIDGRTYIVASGYSAVNVKPGDPNWVDARTNAFAKALLKAKGECARFQESRIKSEMMLEYKEPGPQRAKAEAQRLQREGLAAEGSVRVAQALQGTGKVKDSPVLQTAALYGEKILSNKVNEELGKRGLDPSKPVDQQKVKEVLDTESFSQAVRVTARARCTGIKVLAAFEQNPANGAGEVGVVTIWTEKLHQIADAIASGNFSLIPSGEPGLPVSQHAQLDTRTLLTTFGPMVVRDEKGQYVVLAFAQAQPRSTNPQSIDGAYRKARVLADGMIRQFMGESVALTDDMKRKDESTNFADLDSSYKNDDTFEQKVGAVAEKMAIRGIQEAHSWETLHPANNAPVVGVVAQWKVSASEAASRVKAMNDSSAAAAGASAATPR